MNGDRWIFRRMVEARLHSFPGAQPGVQVADGELIAEVASKAMTTRKANIFQASLSRGLGYEIGSYRTSGGVENPSLAAHTGKPARWHITSENGEPCADLYGFLQAEAGKIARLIATIRGQRVLIYDNLTQPKHLSAHPRAGAWAPNPAQSPQGGVNAYWRDHGRVWVESIHSLNGTAMIRPDPGMGMRGHVKKVALRDLDFGEVGSSGWRPQANPKRRDPTHGLSFVWSYKTEGQARIKAAEVEASGHKATVYPKRVGALGVEWQVWEAPAKANPKRLFPGMSSEASLRDAGYVPCPGCGGTGVDESEFGFRPECLTCKGEGWVPGKAGIPRLSNPSRSLKAQIARSTQRLGRNRKQRRAGARWRAGGSFAQLAREISDHDLRRIRRTGSSMARSYRSPQPPGYGERGRGKVWNPRPGKMRVDDYNAMRAAIEGQLAKWPADAHSQYEAAGLSPMRFRWDALHASKFPIMPLYAYLNDANIDTALRSIMGHGPERETGRKANPKGHKPAPRKETFRETEARYEDWISRAAENWASIANRRSMSGIFGRLYLYVRPSTATQDGALYWLTEDETPDPLWQIATAEGFGSNLTQAQVRAKVWDVARRLPLYAYGSVSNPQSNPKGRIGRRLSKAQALTIARNAFGPDALVDKRGQRFAVYAGRTSVQGVWNILGVGRSWDEALEDANRPVGMPHQIMHNPHRPKFSELAIGEVFRFGSEEDFPMSGMALGPWRKIAPRKYEHTDPTSKYAGFQHRVQSVATPIMRVQGNPSYRLSGTIEEIPDAPPVARRGPGRPRKVRVAPVELAAPLDPVPFEVPAEAPGRELQAGDRVTVPYSGRASYFGRAATKTREGGIFEGYTYENDQRLAFVRVIRGHTVETHAFPVDQVRRHGKTFSEQAAGRQAGRPAKLARLTWKAKGSLAKAEAMLEKATAEHAATEAVAMELYPQHETTPGRPRGRTTAASRDYLNARAKLRRLTERVELLGSVVRSLGGGQEYGEATGTDPWAANRRRYRNPTTRETQLAAQLVRQLGFDAMADDVLSGEYSVARTFQALLAMPGLAESRKILVRTALTALTRGYGSTRETAAAGRAARAAMKAEMARASRHPANRPHPNPTRHIHGPLKNARTVRGAKRKRNPRGSERERAVKTFRMWHEFAPHKITRMKGPDRLIPRTLVKLGDIRSIDYISDKYEGRPVTYTHKTDRPRPVLATDPDGQNLHIIGGRVRITGDGLIH
jgi:hypothetical protein